MNSGRGRLLSTEEARMFHREGCLCSGPRRSNDKKNRGAMVGRQNFMSRVLDAEK